MARDDDGSAGEPSAPHPRVDPYAAVNDPARLRALHRLRLLDTPVEERFERLTRMAQAALDAPVALISLVDSDRQFFKACLGLPEPWASRRETPLSHSFCQYAVATGQELVVHDARQDAVLASNLAVRDLQVIAYAGVPIRSVDGQALGTLCVIDTRARRWTNAELDLLRELAGAVADLLEARLALLERPDRQAVLAQVVEAQEEERRRISAEIHDDTIQTLVAVSLRLQVLAEQAEPDAGRTLNRLATAARDATDRLRRLVVGLRPTGLDRGALTSAIAEHAELILGETTAAVALEVTDDDLPPVVATTFFRIAQEAVANVRAHAGARQVRISVQAADGGAELSVRDDGRGFTTQQEPPAGHFGLAIMRERAQLLGGSLQVRSVPGEGTEVAAWIPLGPSGSKGPLPATG